MGEPTPDPGGAEKVPRAPRLTDLGRLGAELNRLGARYVVVGGFAIIQAGYARFTTDLDLLVDTSPENEAKIFEALRSLPDQAVNQLDPGDIEKFTVVRVGDEILVDLMKSGCGVATPRRSRTSSSMKLKACGFPSRRQKPSGA